MVTFGMKPPVPEELETGKDLPREGMMFVGDKGKIIAGFRCESPTLIPESKMTSYPGGPPAPKEDAERNDDVWIDAFLNKHNHPEAF